MMTIDEIKIGETYFVIQSQYDIPWLLKIKGKSTDDNDIKAISISNDSYYNNDTIWGSVGDIKEIRVATREEKEYLNKCIELNKFIPWNQSQIPKIIDNYEDY